MGAVDTVKAFMNALEANEKDTVTDLLSENFTFSDWTPMPLNKAGFLEVMAELKSGIPGMIFNLHNVQEQGNKITGSIQIAGYQTDSFSIPTLSLPPIPQMARSVSLPVEDVTYIVEDNHISLMNVHHVDGGGIKGLLNQLGFDAPIVQ